MKFILTDKEIEAMEQRMFTKATLKLLDGFRESEVAFDERQAKHEAMLAAREKCAVYFNFNDPNITVFSVERLDHNTEQERTVIGYYVSEALSDKQADNSAEPMISTHPSVGPSGPYVTGTLYTAGVPSNTNITLKKIKQWYFACGRDQHNQLVKQFEESRGQVSNKESTVKKQLLQG